mgnify:CR=1 FL=1
MARSRDHASELIQAGRVTVSGVVAHKPATAVTTDVALVVRADPDRPDYVSRGGHKLAGALDVFEPAGLVVRGRRCLDAGASTGGFTDVLLRRGAAEVVAVDVGYGQLAWRLQQDERVRVVDRTNIRTDLSLELTGGPVALVVGDLSFISLELVLDPLIAVTDPEGDLALMVKPQFEVGREALGKGGVVRDVGLRASAVAGVVSAADAKGWGTRMVTTSPLPGPAGNVEFFVWLRRGPTLVTEADIHSEVAGTASLGVPGERVDP